MYETKSANNVRPMVEKTPELGSPTKNGIFWPPAIVSNRAGAPKLESSVIFIPTRLRNASTRIAALHDRSAAISLTRNPGGGCR